MIVGSDRWSPRAGRSVRHVDWETFTMARYEMSVTMDGRRIEDIRLSDAVCGTFKSKGRIPHPRHRNVSPRTIVIQGGDEVSELYDIISGILWWSRVR